MCNYRYKMLADLGKLTPFERSRLRCMYRWLRQDGLTRGQSKGYVDREAMLLSYRGAL